MRQMVNILLDKIKNNDLEYVKKMYVGGFDIHKNNEAALKLACGEKNLDIVEWLLDHNCNVNIDNGIILDNALTMNDLGLTKTLIRYGAKFENIKYDFFHAWNITRYLKYKAYIDSSLGPKYPYSKKSEKEQLIDSIKINPSIIRNIPKEKLELVPNIEHLLKSDEYGLFERKIMNFIKYIKQK